MSFGQEKFWLGIAAAGVLLVAASLLFFDGSGRDARPVGGADDIEALQQRDDVNVLFLLVDTLRADRLGCYGYERDTSPELDYVAAHGVRFARHLAQSSWTKCSMASLWTALNPHRSGVTRFDHVLADDAVLPAEILREAGFQTVGLWRNGWVDPSFGFAQGFDVYNRPVSRRAPYTARIHNPTVKSGGTDLDATEGALEFLRVNGHERWFLYLHLMDLHEYLYDEDSALFGSTYGDVYDNSIRRVSTIIGVFLAQLAELGHADDTLVVVASDHGEAFLERGYEGHARRVYRESTEVPLLLSFPFRIEGGAVVDVRSRNVDIWPTVLDLLGLPPIPGADGRSLRPEILAAARGEPPPGEPATAVSYLDQTWGRPERESFPTVAVTEGPYRFLRTRELGGDEVRDELFDARGDPEEHRDVLADEPEVAARLRAEAERYLEQEPDWVNDTLELDEMQLRQLRALGYQLP